MHDPRFLIFRAFLLDGLGQLIIILWIASTPSSLSLSIGISSIAGQWGWLLFSFLLYPILGWLFGSYTVLRWRRITFLLLLQRLLITAGACVTVLCARWFINPDHSVWLVHRRIQFLWMSLLTCWSLLVRLVLRRGLLLFDSPRLFLLAEQYELDIFLAAWQRVPHRQRLFPVDALRLQRRLSKLDQPVLVAVSDSFRKSNYIVLCSKCLRCMIHV